MFPISIRAFPSYIENFILYLLILKYLGRSHVMRSYIASCSDYFSSFTKYIHSIFKLSEMAESSSLIVQMDVDEAAIDEGLYSRQL